MTDLTRAEAVQWCRENMSDFKSAVFPPPEGWQWALDNEQTLCLAPIFTITDQGDEIYAAEVFN